MVVILVAVITQVFRVPPESRGDVKGLLWVNSGFFQAAGVISFGKLSITDQHLHFDAKSPLLTWSLNSVRLPYVTPLYPSSTMQPYSVLTF